MADGEPGVERPIIAIMGEKVSLGPLRRDLLPLYDRWFNDFEVGRHYFAQALPHTREEREAWYERFAKGEPNSAQFLIYERATLRHHRWGEGLLGQRLWHRDHAAHARLRVHAAGPTQHYAHRRRSQ